MQIAREPSPRRRGREKRDKDICFIPSGLQRLDAVGARISTSHNLQIVQPHVAVLAGERGPAVVVVLLLRDAADSVIGGVVQCCGAASLDRQSA